MERGESSGSQSETHKGLAFSAQIHMGMLFADDATNEYSSLLYRNERPFGKAVRLWFRSNHTILICFFYYDKTLRWYTGTSVCVVPRQRLV